jgi:hypothetical protein
MILVVSNYLKGFIIVLPFNVEQRGSHEVLDGRKSEHGRRIVDVEVGSHFHRKRRK